MADPSEHSELKPVGPWVHRVEITNFRGVSQASWTLKPGVNCLVGAGDSRKTTLLAAIEHVLWPNYALSLTENDFHQHSTHEDLVITATVANPPMALRTDGKYLSYLHGYFDGNLYDEPTEHQDDLTALRIELRVASDLEPSWNVVKGTHPPRPIRAADRASIGVVRIGEDLTKHIRWSRGSALMRLTTSAGETAEILRDAARSARGTASAGLSGSLSSVVDPITHSAQRLRGIPSGATLTANTDFDATPRGLGNVVLHTEADIPVTRSGQGTQRIVALAAQLSSASTASVLILDELERGLEPHRVTQVLGTLRHALRAQGLEQVLLTTHSPRAIRELQAREIARVVGGSSPTVQPFTDALQGAVRWSAEALLCPRIMVCEGATEAGLVRGLIELLQSGESPTYATAEPADAQGAGNIVGRANALTAMGYEVGVMYDLDKEPRDLEQLNGAVRRFPVESGNATEHQLFADLTDVGVRLAVKLAGEAGTLATGTLRQKLESYNCSPGDLEFLEDNSVSVSGAARRALGVAANTGKWFKRVDLAETLIRALRKEIPETSPYGKLMSKIEAWLAEG